MNTKNKQRTWLISMAIAAALSGCAGESKTTENIQQPVSVVTSLPDVDHNNRFEIGGRVEAVQKADLSTRMMGYIRQIHVKVGDNVKKGQTLISIESSDIDAKQAQAEAMIREAEAALSNAQKDYERFTQLYEQKSASDKELENMRLQYNSASARAEAARQMRNEALAMKAYTQITAPFDGVITQKFADAGSMANPGMPLLSVENLAAFRVSATLPESEIARVSAGDEVMVNIKSSQKTFKAAVSEISASSLMSGGQYVMHINIPDKEKSQLLSGQYATVSLMAPADTVGNSAMSVLVPKSSLVHKEQLIGIYTVSASNTALLRWVRIGREEGGQVEIIAGLRADEAFIRSAQGRLWNGAPVFVSSN